MIKLRRNFAALALAAMLAVLGTACATDDADTDDTGTETEVDAGVESPVETEPLEEAS